MSSSASDRIEAALGHRPDRVSALSGGCVGDVYLAHMANGQSVVAKLGAPASGLDIEGQMLRDLAAHSALPVPEVLYSDEALLILQYLESGGGLGTAVQQNAADHVAALHTCTTDQGFGYAYDTLIGGLHQPNPWTSSWLAFFRDQRLLHMGRAAEKAGRLPTAVLNRLRDFCEKLDHWIEEPERPSLIHGDMWSGNVLSAHGCITGFIDPATYYADPEIELAFTTLFGTFGDAFFDRYREHRPIRPGFFEQRRDLYNLYPLLVHVRLFGGSYVGSVDGTLRKFGF